MQYKPYEYQEYATKFIQTHEASAIFLDCGMGKSVITLTAIKHLIAKGKAKRVLIIAPLRVAQTTWPDEIAKWDHLKGLTYSVAVGSAVQRKEALERRADITIINRENVEWLIAKSGQKWCYDTVVLDELSSFKSYQAKRFKYLLKVRPFISRIVGLTGTPASNGLMDLWAEFRVLDMGERLGRYITRYRENYFTPDKRNAQVVFSYKPLPSAEERIYEKIGDITISMKSKDYLKMPELIENNMTAYEYLSQLTYIDRRIQYDLMELEELRLRSMSVSSPNLGETVAHTQSNDAPFVKVLEIIWQKEERVKREIAELEQKREEIRGAIERLENEDERLVLLYRYLQGMKWEAIAYELHVSLSTIKRWHKAALSKITVGDVSY